MDAQISLRSVRLPTARWRMTASSEREEQLVRRARGGDRQAFEELVREHADRLHAVVLRVCGDVHEAEEVTQETFLRAWRSMERFEGRSQFFTWLYRIGVNETKRRLERGGRGPRIASLQDPGIEVADERPGPDLRAEAGDLQRALERAILDLPVKYRMPLVLRDVEGLSTAEAAVIMDLSEAAFKSRLHRARLAVREVVEPLVGDDA
jgi:RNA polymerase sigma-70 factor (ECF subfamily)